MNRLLALPAIAVLGLSACESLNAPLSSSEYDPLMVPGSGGMASETSFASFRPGQYVRASMDSTGFYRAKPRGNADADRLLQRNTRMKVVSTDSSYVRVELDSGEVGFVPTVMVEDLAGPPSDELPPSTGNEFQVYPPVGGQGDEDPLQFVDPSALPPDDSVPSLMNLETPEIPTEELPADELPPSSPEPDEEEMEDELPPSSPGVDELEEGVKEKLEEELDVGEGSAD